MKNSFSVKTVLRMDKPLINGKYPLYYLVIFNSQNLKLSAKFSLPPSEWDKEKNYPKGVGNSILKKKLQQEESKINNILLNIDLLGKPITKELIKNMYREKNLKKDFYYHLDELYKKKFLIIEKGTQSHYILLRKQLKEYKANLNLEEINRVFIMDFLHHLRTNKKIGEGGIGTRLKCFSAVLNEFLKNDMIDKNPCVSIEKPKENQIDEFLTSEEIERIRKADLNLGLLTNGLNLTRNLFLFSCYTGLRYADVINLKKENIIDDEKIVIEMGKTKRKVEVFLNKQAKIALIKSGYKRKLSNENIFKKRSNVSVNRDLKKIARFTKISKRLHFHLSRHSFGSALAKDGTQPYYIMKLMGHRDIRTTSRYVNSDEKILSNVMKTVTF